MMRRWWNDTTLLESQMSPKPENQAELSLSNKFVGYGRLLKETLRAEMIDKKTRQGLSRWSVKACPGGVVIFP